VCARRSRMTIHMKQPSLPRTIAAGVVLAVWPPIATWALADCDRHGATCGVRSPHMPDNHNEHQVRALGTDTRHYVDTGSGGGDGDAAAMDALLYPEFIGVRPRPEPPFITTGTQEDPSSLWD
jgi:hypothetical protein